MKEDKMIGMGDWRLLERNRELISNKKMRHNVRPWNYYLYVTTNEDDGYG